MSLWESIVLGFIQGATEFLPVSSSGHLVMAQEVLSVNVPGVAFEIAVHVATLVSILLVYRTRVRDLGVGVLTGDRESFHYVGLVAIATVPAALLGVFAKDPIEALFDNPVAPGVALLVTGSFLWSSKKALERGGDDRPGWKAAALIGVAQACALVPGISRSGATVVAAMWLGMEAREAAAFSFLMAVPAVAGAAVLQVGEMEGLMGLSGAALLWGSVVAGVTGVLAIRTFVAMLARRSFHFFAPYCWVVGAAYLVYVSVR